MASVNYWSRHWRRGWGRHILRMRIRGRQGVAGGLQVHQVRDLTNLSQGSVVGTWPTILRDSKVQNTGVTSDAR